MNSEWNLKGMVRNSVIMYEIVIQHSEWNLKKRNHLDSEQTLKMK